MTDKSASMLFQNNLSGYPMLSPHFTALPLPVYLKDDIIPHLPVYFERIPEIHAARHIALISDNNTYPLLGEQITEALSGKSISSHPLPGNVKPDQAVIDTLIKQTEGADLYIGIGSGTISDITKYTSFLAHKPYIMCPTAPSMNGYVSANAAIMVEGHKKSLPAHLPCVLLVDLKTLTHAPLRLIRAGLGDVLCRSTARADWLLSHYAIGTVYNPEPFKQLKEDETALLAYAYRLLEQDKTMMSHLISALLISGYGMVLAGGSYPASQGEHMIAHTMEMKHGEHLPLSFHGEQIAVTTLAMTSLQQTLLERKTPPAFATDYPQQALVDYFGKEVADACKAEYLPKSEALKAAPLTDACWSELKARIAKDYIRYEELEACFERLGLAVTPGGIGWPDEDFKLAMGYAKYTRGRVTFLDCGL
jgi:glycerol-1-phosphate dehydrogenase [NAD(P)+]